VSSFRRISTVIDLLGDSRHERADTGQPVAGERQEGQRADAFGADEGDGVQEAVQRPPPA
jgi:hypothetical protein